MGADSITIVDLLTDAAEPDMERIVTQYGDSLYRMAFTYLKDVHLAEDALQETFIKIYRNYNRFRNESNEKTWMIRIAINVCNDMLRKTWRKVEVAELLDDVPAETHPDSTQYDGVLIEVMNLPEKYKQVILLYYYQDMKTQEISQVLDIPIGTVLVHLKRARALLEKKLERWYYE